MTVLVERDCIFLILICLIQDSSASNAMYLLKKYFLCFLPKACVSSLSSTNTLPLKNCPGKYNRLVLSKSMTNFSSFLDMVADKSGRRAKIEYERCTAVLTERASKLRWNFGRGNAYNRRRSPSTETRSLAVARLRLQRLLLVTLASATGRGRYLPACCKP